MREFTDDWPMMRPLVLVLKLFLQQRELNEVRWGTGVDIPVCHYKPRDSYFSLNEPTHGHP